MHVGDETAARAPGVIGGGGGGDERMYAHLPTYHAARPLLAIASRSGEGNFARDMPKGVAKFRGESRILVKACRS